MNKFVFVSNNVLYFDDGSDPTVKIYYFLVANVLSDRYSHTKERHRKAEKRKAKRR
jgi:hypothetical protein